MENETQSQGETKKCPKCGEQIQTSAKRCKHCQADLRNWFARHKVMTGIIAVVVLIIIAVASGGDKEEMKAGTQETAENKTETKFIAKAMGDDVETKTYKFKINSAEEKASISSGYGNPQPASDGAKFIVVNMDITNMTNEKSTFFPDDILSLADDQGKKFKTYDDTIGNIENYLNVQDLSPSILKKGVLVYEVPEQTAVYDLFIENEGTKEVYQVKLK